jgi:magnesium-transporting ATPase (P-type)
VAVERKVVCPRLRRRGRSTTCPMPSVKDDSDTPDGTIRPSRTRATAGRRPGRPRRPRAARRPSARPVPRRPARRRSTATATPPRVPSAATAGRSPQTPRPTSVALLTDVALCNDATPTTRPVTGPRSATHQSSASHGGRIARRRTGRPQPALRHIGEVPFDSGRKRMTIVHRRADGSARIICRGRGDELTAPCTAGNRGSRSQGQVPWDAAVAEGAAERCRCRNST